VADTTYLPVLGGFIFLVAIIDLFSRKVVGWSLGERLDAELSGEALRRALARRSPPPGLIFHTDRESEFATASFRKLLAEAQVLQSMSRKGDSWDNGVAESFFSTLEFEGPSTSTWRYVSDGEPALPPLSVAIAW
jgi:putative transposase